MTSLTRTLDMPRRQRASHVAWVYAIALILLAAVALTFLVDAAISGADEQAEQTERDRFAQAVAVQQADMARELLTVAQWTKAYKAITGKLDTVFLEDEIVDTLLNEYGHSRVYVVTGGNRIILTGIDKADLTPRQLSPNDPITHIVQSSIDRFMRTRTTIKGGFVRKRFTALEAIETAEMAFTVVDGEAALIAAMPIVPEVIHKLPMPDGPPPILVSFKTINAGFMNRIARMVGVKYARFEVGSFNYGMSSMSVAGPDRQAVGQFLWQGERPGGYIRNKLQPYIVAFAVALTLFGLVAAWRMIHLMRALETNERRHLVMARHDALTGLANRTSLSEALRQAVAGLPETGFAMMIVDLDRFKEVNDRDGHAAGDTVLRVVAERISGAVGSAGLVARTGGDEFVVLVRAFHDRPRLSVLAQQLLSAVPQPIALEAARTAEVGISIGAAQAPTDGATVNAILAAADRALYAGKERGRGCVVFAYDISERTLTAWHAGGRPRDAASLGVPDAAAEHAA